ncbi:MAG: 3-deoxy-7-phosphoheptulonate synthase [Planctomycetota bacterium]
MIVIFPDPSRSDASTKVRARLEGEERDFQAIPARVGEVFVLETGAPEDFSAWSEIQEVRPVHGPWSLVARESDELETRVRFGDFEIGGGRPVVIGGPCSIESDEQLGLVAREVLQAGAHGLRGGAFKPRTSTYAFQGLGRPGLEMLARVRRETGLPVVTEVMSPDEVELVAEFADMLQIGTRNMQNFRLLEAVGRSHRPVLLKRGMMATLDEFLAAAEYVYLRGNREIVLCERGIRSFEPRLRNTLDLGGAALLRRLTHLPVLVDPSHGSGIAEIVPDLARAALAMGADGLLVEVHPCPEEARSDGRQSLRPTEFAELMTSLGAVARAVGRPLATREGASAAASARG